MWIVLLALRRPYTFVVMAMAMLLLGALTIARMPTDILPEIDIPVISIVWNKITRIQGPVNITHYNALPT